MSEDFTYVWLLPLLEKPLEEGAQELPGAIKALGERCTLPADIALQPLVVTALTSHSDYWSGLALKWLEDGFPMDPELTTLLVQSTEDRTLSQSQRHRARKLACRQRSRI